MTTYRLMPMPQFLPDALPDQPTITEMVADPELATLLLERQDRAHLLIMPRGTDPLRQIPDFADPSRPLYLDRDVSGTLWDLESRGVDVAVLHDEEERDSYGIKSADGVISLAVFIGQALLESEIVAVYEHLKERVKHTRGWLAGSRDPDASVKVTFDSLRAEKTAEGMAITITNYSGPADETVELIAGAFRELNRSA